jgi:hypothetical protein
MLRRSKAPQFMYNWPRPYQCESSGALSVLTAGCCRIARPSHALQHAPQVLTAPTGAGKSTWLPLQLLQQGGIDGRILLLEPRRLAARNVAQRLAELLNEQPGDTVGYRMRAQTCVGPNTRLEVVTEGILTRMIQHDPELNGVGLVILDEFHERSLQADLALALLLDVQQGLRDDLKLLVMSATLDNSRLQTLLPDAPLIVSEGRMHPVERRYQALNTISALTRRSRWRQPICCVRNRGRCYCFCRESGRSSVCRNNWPAGSLTMYCSVRCMGRCRSMNNAKPFFRRLSGNERWCWRPISPRPA